MKSVIEIVWNPATLFFVAVVILLISALKKNNSFFNVRSIFRDQFALFKDSPFQYFVFYFVPLLLAVGSTMLKCIDDTILDNFNIVLSIIISMLFTFISILTSKDKLSGMGETVKYETINTALFEVVLCVIALLISNIYLFGGIFDAPIASVIVSTALYYLMFTILLQLFVILKRIKSLS